MSSEIRKAVKLLSAGKLVAIPTETVYGLAANAFDEEAVSEIFEVKNRPKFDPLILHTDSLEKIESWVGKLSSKARLLAQKFWPGPLTLVVPSSPRIPDLVTSGLPSVAFRIPNHPLTLELLKNLDFPLAAPSANPFGYVSPTTAAHVKKQLGTKVSCILDGGDCQVGIESTIVALRKKNELRVLRLGGLSLEGIESVVGKVAVSTHSSSNPAAPGMLKSHYAPRKKLILLEKNEIPTLFSRYKEQKVSVLLFQDQKSLKAEQKLLLSPSGDLKEAARNVFAYLRLLDESDANLILAERLPNVGLGRAINDRLARAAHSEQEER